MVGKLKKQNIRDIWPNESNDFTPWLASNIEILNEELGLDISEPTTEQPLVSFRVDIVADDRDGKVIIENQYKRSDHDHLGKLITYASNVQSTKKAIWIVEDEAPEHRRAVDWLNANTNSCDFLLVKIEVYKIADSEPGAKFTLITGPDDSVRGAGKIDSDLSDRNKTQGIFWEMFLESLKEKSDIYSNISAQPRPYIGCGTGLRGTGYNVVVIKDKVQVEIYIDRGKGRDEENIKIFNTLLGEKIQIEQAFGGELIWEELPTRRACRIRFQSNIGGLGDKDSWESAHEFLVDNLIKLKEAFHKPISKISF
jgi:hypothetical protein